MLKKSKFNVFTFMLLIILGLTFQPAIPTYAACPDGISSYWKLDESTPIDPGGTYADFISDNDGTGSANPAATTDGIVNGAQQFDGATNTGIDVEADSSFSWFQDESFSIEFWIKRDGGTGAGGSNEVAIGRDDGDPATSLHWWVGILGNDVNTATFTLGDNNDGTDTKTITGAKNITDNEWHHVVAVRDGENGQNLLYVDGALDGSDLSATYDSGFDSTTAKLTIGYLDAAFRLNGFLDEVALYNRVLTEDEIVAHYSNGLPEDDYCSGGAPFVPFPDDTISLWKLDEAAGPDYADAFSDNEGTGSADPAATTYGIVNGAQQFDGANTGIDVSPDSSFSWFQNESFSIEFWIKRDGNIVAPDPTEVAIGRDDGAPATKLHWWVGIDKDTNTAVFSLGDNNGGLDRKAITGAKNITNNEWHHVVAVRNGDSGQNLLYVDGALDVSDAATYDSGFDSTTADLNIGYLNLNPFFRLNGFLDEVALYSRALTADEIEEHYEDGLIGLGINDVQEFFEDVPPGYWAENFIYRIFNQEITRGCSLDPLLYCPEETVSRAEMAVFLGRAKYGSGFTPPPATGIFEDVPVSHWAAAWIEQIYDDGITNGCSTNPLLYCPDDPITRDQMAVLLLKAKQGSGFSPPSATGIFDDVPVSYWAADWIEQLYADEITNGCSSDPLLYCPEEKVSRAEMAVFLVRTFGI